MIAHDPSSLVRDGPVLVISPGTVLSAAVVAGLRAIGWVDASVAADPPAWPMATRHGIVLVADEHDALPVLATPNHAAASRVVAIASPAAGPALLAALERGARLVDADQPLQAQLREVDRALAGEPPVLDQSAELESVRRWMREADRVASLTGREGQVLEMLMCGWPAGEIAGHLVVSLPTVRTHVRSITRKLGVSSQLAAVALAYRCRCGVGRRLSRSHQF